MSGALRTGTLVRMALRANLLQSTWNYERQQGIGWAYALQPALEALYPDAEVRRARLAEHVAYFNTQPTLASLALGAAAHLEEQRAGGTGPDAEGMARVKAALGSTLAALGDRLFWFSLRTLGVGWGYARGPAVLGGALRTRLEATVSALAYAGCMVLGVVVAWALVPGGEIRPIAVQSALAGGLGLGLLTAQRARPSPTQWALGLGVLVLLAAWMRRG